MTQTFQKKALVVSIAAALFGGSALAFAPAALANQFESSVVEPIAFVPIRADAAIAPAVAVAVAQANTKIAQVKLTATSPTLAGKFRAKLPGSVQLVDSTTGLVINMAAATSIATAVNVLATGIVVTGSTITPSAALAYKSGGETVIEFTAPAGTAGQQIALQAYVWAAPGTVPADVNMTIVDGDSATGATPIGLTGGSFKVTQIVSEVAIITADAPKTVISGLTNQAAANINITFAEQVTITGKEINLTLANATLAPSAVAPLSPACTILDAVTHVATATTCAVSATGVVTFTAGTTVNPGDKLVISNILLNVSTTAVGSNVSATVSSAGPAATTGIANFGTATFDIATAAGPGITVTGVDIAPTGYDTVYAGRLTQKITDGVKITESIPGSLTQNGVIVYKLSTGRFSAGMTVNSSDATVTCGTVPAGQALESVNCQVNSTPATARAVTLTIPAPALPSTILDMRSATVGDLMANLTGTAGAVADVKIGTVIQATSSTADGNPPSISFDAIQNETGDLPTIVITENKVGALVPGGNVLLAIDDGLRLQDSKPPVIKVFNSSGTELTGYFGTPVFSAAPGVITTTGNRVVELPLLLSSTTLTGPLTIKVSGLQAVTVITSSGTGSPTGNYNMTVTGSMTAGDIANGLQSDKGAKPWTESFKIATVIPRDNSGSSVVVTGPITAQTVIGNFAPAGNDVNKAGAVFVFGYIPSYVAYAPNTYWFFDNNRNWNLFMGCETAVPYFVGNLTALSGIPVVQQPADLTALIGAELYFGYGLGGILDPLGVNTATCKDMERNNRYSKVMTVQ